MPATAAEQASRLANHHQSSVDTILGCPRRYFLEYVLAVPQPEKLDTVAGTALHAAVELHERARMAGEAGVSEPLMQREASRVLAELTASASDELLAGHGMKRATPANKKKLALLDLAGQAAAGRERLADEASSAVWNWWHSPVDEAGTTVREALLSMEPLRIEHYLKVAAIDGAAPLAGTMDGLYRDVDGTVVLVDQKTSWDMRGWGPNDDEHRDQATFYSVLSLLDPELAALGVTELPPMLFAVTRRQTASKKTGAYKGAALQWVQPDAGDVEELGKRVRMAQAIQDAGDFPANPAYKFCRWCPFYERCAPGDGSLARDAQQMLLEITPNPYAEGEAA